MNKEQIKTNDKEIILLQKVSNLLFNWAAVDNVNICYFLREEIYKIHYNMTSIYPLSILSKVKELVSQIKFQPLKNDGYDYENYYIPIIEGKEIIHLKEVKSFYELIKK